MDKLKCLVVEDEKNISELLTYNLEEAGYEVKACEDGREALQVVDSFLPNLIILDLMLPYVDGIEVCRRVRSKSAHANVAIIMLTAKGTEIDKVLGLEMGADDYITKPFAIRELLARIKAVMRRMGMEDTSDGGTYVINGLTVDVERHLVYTNDTEYNLTYKEFELLKTLIKNKGKVLSRDYLLDKIWGYDYFGETRTVDVHIRHLRKKLENSDKKYIETIRGVGYKIP